MFKQKCVPINQYIVSAIRSRNIMIVIKKIQILLIKIEIGIFVKFIFCWCEKEFKKTTYDMMGNVLTHG